MKTLADWIDLNPAVKLEKGTPYPFVGMDVIAPGCRYVRHTEERIYAGGGAKFCAGDTLFARITPCLENGKIAQFVNAKSESSGFGSTEFFVLRAINGRSDPAFVFYLSQTDLIRNTAINSMVGASGRQRADIKVLQDLAISLPSLDEQKRIACVLSGYDDLIENNQCRIALLEESARLLYREWFVNLRYPGYESMEMSDGLPNGWVRATVDAFGKIETGKTPPTSNPAYFDGDIPFIKTPDMHGRMIVNSSEQKVSAYGSDFLKGKLLPVGSLLVSCIGTVGVVSITGKQSHTNQQINAVIPKRQIYRAYLYFALSGLREYMLGLGGGSTMNNISKSKFSHMPIIKPQDPILVDFEELVSPLLSQIEILFEANARLASARDSLLPKLMSGEIQV